MRRKDVREILSLPPTESGHYPMDECPLMLASILSEFLDPRSKEM
jgi:hypothetical protein